MSEDVPVARHRYRTEVQRINFDLKGEGIFPLFLCAPGRGRTHLEVKVLYTSEMGKC